MLHRLLFCLLDRLIFLTRLETFAFAYQGLNFQIFLHFIDPSVGIHGWGVHWATVLIICLQMSLDGVCVCVCVCVTVDV